MSRPAHRPLGIRGLLLVVAFAASACPETEPPRPDANTPDRGSDDAGDDMRTSDVMEDSGTVDSDAEFEPDQGSDGEPAIRTFPAECNGEAPTAGADWNGWANLQFPLAIEIEAGDVTEPIFGQVWREGATEQPGVAEGWEAQLVVGPLSAHPEDQPECFRAVDAEFNTDVDNNDEWWVRLRPESPGVYGMFYRYRPPGGAWLYGDANGSDDGTQATNAGVLAVEDPRGVDEVRVVTLNLRCRTDEWDRRAPLVLDALAEIDPHVIGFQEDCAEPGGTPQSFEIQRELAARLDRGYEAFRLVTHQADHPNGTFDEGIAMLTAFPVEQHYGVDLPYANFPRKATVMDVRIGGGEQLRLINTHFDYGVDNESVRADAAARIVEEVGELPTILTGDFNATPDSAAVQTLTATFEDAWAVAHPDDAGFTMPADSPTRRIDYVFVRTLSVDSARLVDRTSGDLHLSDHLGIRVTISP